MCCALAWTVPSQAAPTIQLKILEGEGTTYSPGSRATRGITVLVTDASGNPVENAAVTFRLPDQGPSGEFSPGKRSQTVTTGTDGRATVWGMQWNKTPGQVEILITAAKNDARASVVATQTLGDSTKLQSGGEGVFESSHHGNGKWILIGVAVAGAAAAGMMLAHSHGSSSSAATPALSIGTPTITVSHP